MSEITYPTKSLIRSAIGSHESAQEVINALEAVEPAAIEALTGDVTATGPGTVPATITDGHVTNAKLATMAATTVKGNVTGSTAAPTDLTKTQLTTLINPFTSLLSGAAPASGGGTTNFLRADGSWSPAASGMIGGSTGAVDNSLLRADGTGGATLQAGSGITLDDSGVMDFGEVAGPGVKIARATFTTGNSVNRPALMLASGGRFQLFDNGSQFGSIQAGEIEFGNAAFGHGFYIDSVAATIDFGMLNNDGAFEFHVHAGTLRPLASDANGNLQAGIGNLATSATSGDFYIPSCNGTPTGVPTTISGYVAMRWDRAGFKLYVYDNGTWNPMN